MNLHKIQSMRKTLELTSKRYAEEAQDRRISAKQKREAAAREEEMAEHFEKMAEQFDAMAGLYPADPLPVDDVVDA